MLGAPLVHNWHLFLCLTEKETVEERLVRALEKKCKRGQKIAEWGVGFLPPRPPFHDSHFFRHANTPTLTPLTTVGRVPRETHLSLREARGGVLAFPFVLLLSERV